jgi:hypothetical protein
MTKTEAVQQLAQVKRILARLAECAELIPAEHFDIIELQRHADQVEIDPEECEEG